MNPNTFRKFRWFWAWQDEQEEAWLSEMATRGYHLEKPQLFGIYHFQVGDPDNVIYRLDYNVLGKRTGNPIYSSSKMRVGNMLVICHHGLTSANKFSPGKRQRSLAILILKSRNISGS